MKKLFKSILFLSITSLFFVACNENDNDVNIYNGESFISFGQVNSGQILENATNPIKITAYASVPNITESFTVDVTVQSADATASDYEVVGNKSTLTFGPNQYSDVIEIMPIDNLATGDDRTITITLSNASNGTAIGLPGPDGLGATYTLSLLEDDCPFTVQELGDASWAGVDNVPAGQAGPNSSLITTSFDGTNLLLEGIGYAWLTDTAYWDEVIIDSQKVIAQVDALTGDITIELQYMARTTWNGDVQPDYSIQGTGKYVSCSKTMTINYDIVQGGGVLRSFTETIEIQ